MYKDQIAEDDENNNRSLLSAVEVTGACLNLLSSPLPDEFYTILIPVLQKRELKLEKFSDLATLTHREVT